IPIISKADCYTVEEMALRKTKLRYELEQLGLNKTPSEFDKYYQDIYELVEERWPFAAVASTNIVNTTEEGLIRARSYPWGLTNIDDESFNDLGLLQSILFSSLLIKLQKHSKEQFYEGFRETYL